MKRKAVRKELTGRSRFAANVRLHRLELGMSQEALAEAANLHRTYVGSIERGARNVTIDNMERIAHALNLDVIDLLKAQK
jgi:transcriptional regulator with XRE-family HTH domain